MDGRLPPARKDRGRQNPAYRPTRPPPPGTLPWEGPLTCVGGPFRKHTREADGLEALTGLGERTKTELSEMIANAQSELVDRIGPAVDEFPKTAPELAALLKAVWP